MKRILVFVFVLMFAIPVLAEPIKLETMLTDYERHAKGIGILVDAGDKVLDGMMYTYDDLMILASEQGVVLASLTISGSSTTMQRKLGAFLAAFAYNGTDITLDMDLYESEITEKILLVLGTTGNDRIMLSDAYAAYYGDGGVQVMKLLETP